MLLFVTACGGGGGGSGSNTETVNTPDTTPEANPNLAVVAARAAVITDSLKAELSDTSDINLSGIWLSTWGSIGSDTDESWDLQGFEILYFVDNGTSVTVNECHQPAPEDSWTLTFTESGDLEFDLNLIGEITNNHLINITHDSSNGSAYAENLIKLSDDLNAVVGSLQINDSNFEFDCSYYLKGSITANETTQQQDYIYFRDTAGPEFLSNALLSENDSITIEGKVITVVAGSNTAVLTLY